MISFLSLLPNSFLRYFGFDFIIFLCDLCHTCFIKRTACTTIFLVIQYVLICPTKPKQFLNCKCLLLFLSFPMDVRSSIVNEAKFLRGNKVQTQNVHKKIQFFPKHLNYSRLHLRNLAKTPLAILLKFDIRAALPTHHFASV
jgi:hypothetical protein